MKSVDQATFLNSLQIGDLGIIKGNYFFATMQNWFRIECEKAPSQYRASHAFIIKKTPFISEANGLLISEGKMIKNIGNSTVCWAYRYSKCTPDDQLDILRYCSSQEEKTFYSALGIFQLAKIYAANLMGIPMTKVKTKDEPGKFCSEYDVDMMIDRDWPVPETPSYLTTPSGLNYFLATTQPNYFLSAYYDGKGGYFINE
jgi:hypothetical protein